MEILKTIDLKKYYGTGENQVKALDGVNLSVEEGEFLAVVGTSGSGKSTLLHMLGGLDYATSGSVLVSGKEIFKLNESELTIFRRRNIGFIFQNYNLVPILNVYENIVLPIQLDGERPDKGFIREIMEILGIFDKKNSMPNQLSGGQQAESGNRQGSCQQAGHYSGRRAYGKSGFPYQSGGAWTSEADRRAVFSDHCYDHP